MKKILITASVAGVLLIGSVAFVSITSDDVATAQSAPSTDSLRDLSGDLSGDIGDDINDDTTIGSLVDLALNRLQDLGVLTPEAIGQINGAIDEAPVDLDDMTVDDVKELIAGLDWDSMMNNLQGEIEGLDLENLDLENLDLEDLELPDGWEMPEGFDEEWLDHDWFKDFSFDTFNFPDHLEEFMSDFELPDGFNLDSFDMDGFSFDGDRFKDVDPEDLMEAFKNGTIDELFGFDSDSFSQGFEWFGPWLDEFTTQSVHGASA